MIWAVSLKVPWVRLETYETFTSKPIFGSIKNLGSTCLSTHKLKDPSIIVLRKREGIRRSQELEELKGRKRQTEQQELTKAHESSALSPLPHSCVQTVSIVKNSPFFNNKGRPTPLVPFISLQVTYVQIMLEWKTAPACEPFSVLSWEEELIKVQLARLLDLLRIRANVPFSTPVASLASFLVCFMTFIFKLTLLFYSWTLFAVDF